MARARSSAMSLDGADAAVATKLHAAQYQFLARDSSRDSMFDMNEQISLADTASSGAMETETETVSGSASYWSAGTTSENVAAPVSQTSPSIDGSLGISTASVNSGGSSERRDDWWILAYPTPDIHDVYTLGDQIGQPGQFGRAYRCVHRTSFEHRAVKIVSKTKFPRIADRRTHWKELRNEIDILQRMSHEHIITLYDVFETREELFLVTELCLGGELFERIKAQPAGSYTEQDAQIILRQICRGLAYLHRSRICHCDLKPDNFLFVDAAPFSPLRIIDFGMSKFVKRRQHFHSLRGTPYYIAPEVIKGFYNEACDMWSFGIVMFVMLFGYPPFHGDGDAAIFRQILAGFTPVIKKGYRAHFPLAIPCSEAGRDLISKLLTSDTARRLTAEEALEHPWLSGQDVSSKPIVLDVLTNLKNFSAHTKFKQDILNLMVNTLSESDLLRLKGLFTELDADGNGYITLGELTEAVENCNSLAEELGAPNGESDSRPKFTRKELECLLNAADMDNDGKLSYNELVLTLVQRKLSAKEERLWEAFQKIDRNNDGILTEDEIMAVLGKDAEAAREMIASVDRDGDNCIDFDEFLDLWLKREEEATAEGLAETDVPPPKKKAPPMAEKMGRSAAAPLPSTDSSADLLNAEHRGSSTVTTQLASSSHSASRHSSRDGTSGNEMEEEDDDEEDIAPFSRRSIIF